MKISYAITVCKELEEIQKLIRFLLEYKRDDDGSVHAWCKRLPKRTFFEIRVIYPENLWVQATAVANPLYRMLD